MRHIIMDAGPLVAWLCPRDEHHVWTGKAFSQMKSGGLVCEAVLAEVCHLASKEGIRPGQVLEFVESGSLEVVPLARELPAIRALTERYTDAPMDFADACVVRMAEIYAGSTVCTTDGHFRFFRKNGGEKIPLIAPFAS